MAPTANPSVVSGATSICYSWCHPPPELFPARLGLRSSHSPLVAFTLISFTLFSFTCCLTHRPSQSRPSQSRPSQSPPVSVAARLIPARTARRSNEPEIERPPMPPPPPLASGHRPPWQIRRVRYRLAVVHADDAIARAVTFAAATMRAGPPPPPISEQGGFRPATPRAAAIGISAARRLVRAARRRRNARSSRVPNTRSADTLA